MLPNLIVIGAAKCGTTSLHEYLDEHPEISMSRQKELDFFVPEKSGDRDLAWYAAQFEDAPVRGESSPSYTAHPFYSGPPERIAAVLPDVRLVYLVRDPIARIVSHYVHRSGTYPEMGTLEESLDHPDHGPWMIGLSRYWLQLERYLARFPAERILVVDSDELRARRPETLSQIFAFAGVDPSFRSEGFEVVHTPGRTRTRRNPAGRALLGGLAKTLGPSRTHRLVTSAPGALKAPFRRMLEPPVLGPAARERLEEELAPDTQRLRAHTGLAFGGWTV
ncbi:MAG: hypothetical protein QOF50_1640 [Gaiellaceae bacterium]|nr:hypothetical protein [Gaiellaceae bacterium]